MPNNLVFNQVANELKTAIYGSNDGTTFTPIKTLASGEVLVTGTVEVTGTVAIANTLTVTKDTATNIFISAGLVAITQVLSENTLNRSMYSYYVANSGTDTVIAKLQVSPTTTAGYFVDDSTAIATITTNQTVVLVPKNYLNYTRLYLSPQGTANVTAYYNAQS